MIRPTLIRSGSGRHGRIWCLDRVRVARHESPPADVHPKERLAYKPAKAFSYRAGPYDFGCVTAMAKKGKRIGCRICRK